MLLLGVQCMGASTYAFVLVFVAPQHIYADGKDLSLEALFYAKRKCNSYSKEKGKKN